MGATGSAMTGGTYFRRVILLVLESGAILVTANVRDKLIAFPLVYLKHGLRR